MAISLSAPAYSFVQMVQPSSGIAPCVPAVPICLPVYTPLDLSFQLTALVSGDDKTWFEEEYDQPDSGLPTPPRVRQTIWGKVCRQCGDQSTEEPALATSFAWSADWTRLSTGVTDVWVGNFTYTGNPGLFSQLEYGECFNICFYKVTVKNNTTNRVEGMNTELVACTAVCFQRVPNACFTSYFLYSCNENTFGFRYVDDTGTPNFANRVRLPCYITNMQLPSDEKSYTLSNGTKIKLYERIEEEYELLIDYMPRQFHINLKVLLSHDNLSIQMQGGETGGPLYGFVCREKYDINWPEMPYANATAKTKVVRSAAVSLINNNCA